MLIFVRSGRLFAKVAVIGPYLLPPVLAIHSTLQHYFIFPFTKR